MPNGTLRLCPSPQTLPLLAPPGESRNRQWTHAWMWPFFHITRLVRPRVAHTLPEVTSKTSSTTAMRSTDIANFTPYSSQKGSQKGSCSRVRLRNTEEYRGDSKQEKARIYRAFSFTITLCIFLYHSLFLVCKTSIHRFESGRRLR
jgi:hypothetical protein